jgi:phosphoglycerate kinase
MRFLSKLSPDRLRGKIVLVRVDLNIEAGMPLQSERVQASVPTLALLAKYAGGVVILSHRGRPVRGEDETQDRSLSLKPFTSIFTKKLGKQVRFVPREECLDKKIPGRIRAEGGVWLLENLRLFPGEMRADRSFAKKLKALGDLYVQEAFSVSHRADASVAVLPKLMPSYAGLRLEEELLRLKAVMGRVAKPLTLVLGGGKIEEKIGMVETLGKRADHILLGGGPANTFFAAMGLPVGDSLVDEASLPFARKHLHDSRLVLPVDLKVQGRRILDIGPETAARYAEIIASSCTVVWNGPMGFVEQRTYAHGTEALWRALAKHRRSTVVVGGGETTASLALFPDVTLSKHMFLSTGGGAMLEFLAGKKLPGIQALR